MSDLYVILKSSLSGPDINLVPGDQYPVQSKEQGDLMVERDLAYWPSQSATSEETAETVTDPVVEQPAATETLVTDSNVQQAESTSSANSSAAA